LERLIGRFIKTQTKTNEVIDESVSQLNTKFESLSTNQKMMDMQLAQIAQEVSHLSRPQGQLPSYPEAISKGHMNSITLRSGKQLNELKQVKDRRVKVWSGTRENHQQRTKLI